MWIVVNSKITDTVMDVLSMIMLSATLNVTESYFTLNLLSEEGLPFPPQQNISTHGLHVRVRDRWPVTHCNYFP